MALADEVLAINRLRDIEEQIKALLIQKNYYETALRAAQAKRR